MLTEGKTTRQQQEAAYQIKALRVLDDDPEFTWIIDVKNKPADQQKLKPGALAAIGRLDDPDELREVARIVCERKLSTKQTIALVRRYRLGRNAVGTRTGLWKAVAMAVRDFIAVYPDTPLLEVAATLRRMATELEKTE